MDFTKLSIKNLKDTCNTWNKETKYIILFIGGGSNMFGGNLNYLYIHLHGENSIYETGLISIIGILKGDYNISRGANLRYFKGIKDFDNNTYNIKPTYEINVKESCHIPIESMCSMLSSSKDSFIDLSNNN